MKLKNPCKDCISIPICINRYKKYEGYRWPVFEMKYYCKILNEQYMLYEQTHDLPDNPIDIWWKKTYDKFKNKK